MNISDWIQQFPVVLSMLFIVIVVAFAFLARKAVAIIVSWVNRASSHLGSEQEILLSANFTRLLQFVAFWGILLAALVLGLSLLGNGELSDWLDRSWIFVTSLLVAMGIVAVGHVLGSLTRDLVSGTAWKNEFSALPQITYAGIVGAALVIALGYLGLDVSFVSQLILVLVTVFFGGLALAFALGAKTLVANLSAGGELAHYKTGDHLQIDGVKGTILEIHRTGMILSTADGICRIPARKFAELTVTVLREENKDG